MRHILLFSLISSLALAAHAQPPAAAAPTANGAKPAAASQTTIDPVTGKPIILLGFDGPGKGFKPEKTKPLNKKSATPNADEGAETAAVKKAEKPKEAEPVKENKLRSDSALRSDASLARDKRAAEEKAAAEERAINAPKAAQPATTTSTNTTTTTTSTTTGTAAPAADSGLPLLPTTTKNY
jgi:type IV secretory pathway VirB10-like protein